MLSFWMMFFWVFYWVAFALGERLRSVAWPYWLWLVEVFPVEWNVFPPQMHGTVLHFAWQTDRWFIIIGWYRWYRIFKLLTDSSISMSLRCSAIKLSGSSCKLKNPPARPRLRLHEPSPEAPATCSTAAGRRRKNLEDSFEVGPCGSHMTCSVGSYKPLYYKPIPSSSKRRSNGRPPEVHSPGSGSICLSIVALPFLQSLMLLEPPLVQTKLHFQVWQSSGIISGQDVKPKLCRWLIPGRTWDPSRTFAPIAGALSSSAAVVPPSWAPCGSFRWASHWKTLAQAWGGRTCYNWDFSGGNRLKLQLRMTPKSYSNYIELLYIKLQNNGNPEAIYGHPSCPKSDGHLKFI